MHFIRNNLKRIRLSEGFNAQTRLEIDERIFSELLVNSLTVDKIKVGLAIHRNPILNSVCTGVLPYSGYGSGIKRVVKLNPAVVFVDDREKEEFRCLIPRLPTN